MKMPNWLPRDIRRVEKSLIYTTIRRIHGVNVTCHWVWGLPYRAMQMEIEDLVYFSNRIEVFYLNGSCLADTSHRANTPFNIRKVDRMEIETGERSVFYDVCLSDGVAVDDVAESLENILKQEECSKKEMYVDQILWRKEG